MARNRKKPETEEVGGAPPGGGRTVANVKSALFGPLVTPALLEPPVPGYIDGPFGIRYATKRRHLIPDDVPQIMAQDWAFDIRGYLQNSAPTGGNPTHFALPTYVLENWYSMFRQTMQVLNKHRASAYNVSLTDTQVLREYLNLYHNAVANCCMLLCAAQLRQYTRGMVIFTENMTDAHVSEAVALWRRLSAIAAPPLLKSMSIMDGMPIAGPFDRCLFWRRWRPDLNEASFGARSVLNSVVPYTMAGAANASNVELVLTSIADVVEVLEGVSSTGQDDLTLMLDLIHMASHSSFEKTKNIFVPGLPAEYSWTPIRVDEAAWNELLRRGIMHYDTHGASADEINAFPILEESECGDLVPIQGKGAPTMNDFTLMGMAKAYQLKDDNSLFATAVTDGLRCMGTSHPILYSASDYTTNNPIGTGGGDLYLWNVEDEWETLDDSGTDWGDGAAIRAMLNAGGIAPLHIYFPILFAGQLDASLEFRFLDRIENDYCMYVPIDDLFLNHGIILSQMLGVPSLIA